MVWGFAHIRNRGKLLYRGLLVECRREELAHTKQERKKRGFPSVAIRSQYSTNHSIVK